MNLISKWKIYFRPRAANDFKELPAITKKRIAKKMRFFVSRDNLLEFAKPLKDNQLGEYRFRIGNYRVIFNKMDRERKIVILKVAKRDEIYK